MKQNETSIDNSFTCTTRRFTRVRNGVFVEDCIVIYSPNFKDGIFQAKSRFLVTISTITDSLTIAYSRTDVILTKVQRRGRIKGRFQPPLYIPKLPLASRTRVQQEVSLERSSAQWHAEEGPLPPTSL
jgi:hypothetical protein